MHAKNVPTKILFDKELFDFSQTLRQCKKNHFEIKHVNFSLESKNVLLIEIFGQTPEVGVNYVTLVLASVETYRGRS